MISKALDGCTCGIVSLFVLLSYGGRMRACDKLTVFAGDCSAIANRYIIFLMDAHL